MEITKSKKMHKSRKSLNISRVKTSTVSCNCFKSCSQSTVNQKNYSFVSLSFVHLLTFTFIKVFSSSFQSMFRGLISGIGGGLILKASCCQIILYILYFGRFLILIFNSILQYQVSVTF